MSFQRTYVHTVLVAIDQTAAAVLFNRDDVTISSLCGLVRRMDAGNHTADFTLHVALQLRPWQIGFLRFTGTALEKFWPGHCEGAISSDVARGARAQAILAE